jgi:Clostripain family/Bacterial Ig-like domain (group 2)
MKSSKYLSVALLTAFLLLLLGCGGGGGGGGVTKYSLTYTTDWGAAGTPSQRVTVKTSSGTVADSIVINAARTTDSHTFTGLVAGTYTLTSELYSAPNAGGSVTGTVAKTVVLTGPVSIRSSVTAAATGIAVTPTDPQLVSGTSQQFSAAFVGASGQLIFGDAAFSWSKSGTAITVSPTGNVSANSVGTGTVTASANSLSGSSNVTVVPSTSGRKKWTILLFLNASNNLYPYSKLNMNQIEAVATNPDVRIIVQWKQNQTLYPSSSFDGTRRYLVTHDTNTNQISSQLIQDLGTGVDMGKPETLTNFINWANDHYPADHTALILWNHGNGWQRSQLTPAVTRGISYDDEFNSAIDTWQLAQAIGDHHFDYIAFDACLMQMMEVSYEIKDKADYLVGSEELTPAPGFRYDKALKAIMDDATISTLEATKGWVDCMVNEPSYESSNITQSVVDTSKLQAVATAASALADVLKADPGSRASLVQDVRNHAQRYDAGTLHLYYDLWDIANRLKAGDATLTASANAVQAAVESAVVYEKHNALSPGSHGIGIDFSPKTYINLAAYNNLRFATVTDWDEWLAVAP